MSAPISPETYQTYRGLPPLAGLCTHAEAAKPGLSVEECVRRLKRFHYCFKRLHEIFTARITAEPIYELKVGFSHHAYLCAEHVEALRKRIGEMREPPLGLEEVPHSALEVFFDEILAAPTTEELIEGILIALGSFDLAITDYQWVTNPLTDAPSKRMLRFANMEIDDMRSFHDQTLSALHGAKARDDELGSSETCLVEQSIDFETALFSHLKSAGGLDGANPATGEMPARRYSVAPYRYDPIPRRDERFQDLFNQGVNAEAFIYDEALPAKPKALMMLFKRLREIDVPEMMASIITQTKGKPWGYYLAMTRQLWDEARHAMMGEVGYVALGIDWTKARITHNWSLRLNTECTPIERHAVLYFIEQGLMTRTGKRYEWELGRESGIPLMATIQDFDWADEVLHAAIGREWHIPQFGDLKKALAYGDECWSRILSNWRTVLDQGLTRHENWWPAIYEQACKNWGEKPDPNVLAFNTNYEGARADLKEVAAGASG
jgi:hypothetical protein